MTTESLSQTAVVVAPKLLGCRLTSESTDGVVTVELTEVEAYEGESDPASHAYGGETVRNRVMFGPAGHLYVYRSHGLHWCCNVVTGQPGTASAVLLRAGRLVEGFELARERRGERVSDTKLARGPGNLAQALGITHEHNGAYLLGSGPLTLAAGDPTQPSLLRAGPRVGIARAAEWPWRFYVAGDRTVSAYRRSSRAGPIPS